MKHLLSVWLIPAEKDEKYLKKIIDKLGKENNSPTFIPHLTLFGDTNIELDELKEIINEVFSKIKSFKIKKIKINQSEVFFKTVFIEFQLNEKLIKLYHKLAKKTDKRDITTFKPHMSLIYKTMPKEEKLRIIEKLNIKDDFLIDKVIINAPKIGDKDFLNIEGWRTLYKKKLND